MVTELATIAGGEDRLRVGPIRKSRRVGQQFAPESGRRVNVALAPWCSGIRRSVLHPTLYPLPRPGRGVR